MVIKILVLIGIIAIIDFFTIVEMRMRDTTLESALETAPITTILKSIFYIYLIWVWIGTWYRFS
jgi:hypothetical protein